MRKIVFTSLVMFSLAGSVHAQYPALKVETALYNPQNTFPTIQSSQANAMSINTGDTLRYFLNKHYFRNSAAGNPAPNTQYFTLSNPYTTTLNISHAGGVFLNASPIVVTGLEGIVTVRPNSASPTIPVKLYLCNVNASNLPVFPPLDSVTAVASATTNGAWLGANFITPVNVSGKFAVLYRCASTVAGDTLGLFINNACTPTSTCPVARRFGEGLGVMRIGGTFQSNTNLFGTGTDYEFIVAPRVQFVYSAGITAVSPTVCLNGSGQFINATSPTDLVENRQFNFNKFASVWGPLSNTLLPTTDSIYTWSFSGSTTGPLTSNNAIAVFNANGIQTASLAVKYNKSRSGGFLPSVQDVATATVNVSSANTPTVSMSGNTLICSGSSSTLTASGTATYNWGGPQFNNPVTIVSPTATTVYTCIANNGFCLGYYNYTVNVTPNPTLVINGPSTACLGSTLLLTVSGANSYTWSNGPNTFSLAVSGGTLGIQTYSVFGETAPCAAVMAVRNITVHPLPSVSVSAPVSTVCSTSTGGSTVQLTGTPSGGQFSGTFVNNGIFTPNAVITATINYSYTNPSTQCAGTASTTIGVLACAGVGISESDINSKVTLFPNPSTNGKIEISHLEGSNTICIYNSLGELTGMEKSEAAGLTLDFSNASNGVYFIKVNNENGSGKTFRAVIQK
jgi:hypothetical protein